MSTSSIMKSGDLCDFINQSLKASDSKLNAMDRYIQRAKQRMGSQLKENVKETSQSRLSSHLEKNTINI